jgi:hypothetical protein
VTSLYVGIVAHQKRYEMAFKLATNVKADEVFMDDGFKGEWKNHEYAWRAAARSGCTHAVILQDDAVPIEDFRAHALRACEERPHNIISVYTGTHRPRKEQVLHAVKIAENQNASWLTADTLMWGVGVILPVERIESVLSEAKKSKLPYDQRLGFVFQGFGELVYHTWPSLVDHADEPTVISGRPDRQGQRVAHKVGVPDWNDKSIHIEHPGGIFVGSTKDNRLTELDKSG